MLFWKNSPLQSLIKEFPIENSSQRIPNQKLLDTDLRSSESPQPSDPKIESKSRLALTFQPLCSEIHKGQS